jgi:hypothetical protein
MNKIKHDLNESAQMFTGASYWLGLDNIKNARECIDRGKELLIKAEALLITEELLREVDSISTYEDAQSVIEDCEHLTGMQKINALLNGAGEL